ncbi:hypothetical protein SCHPADRAFT_566993 [Schizopora paradoxa]|uniref:Uncharacterized protein n=1 Tax=Schizopora paradoxa TaxID=27342 RepID=A0A0H2RBX3_9AGAM|nr:hypothetical protein SCHPADRAFT_566993 [Schizopora paradoxa]
MLDIPPDVLAQAAGSGGCSPSGPFKSRTDELVASLRMGDHGISSSALDVFLALVRHPEFRPDALTFQSASDIDQRVAVHRKTLARERSYRTVREHAVEDGGCTQLRLPFEILLNIIDQVSDSRPNFDGLSSGAPHNGVVERLKALSLTHRSLTIPSQRALSSRLTSWSPLHIAGLSHSPLLGDHTRELVLILNLLVSRTNREALSVTGSVPTTFSELVSSSLALVKRASKLEALKVVPPSFVSEGIQDELLRFLRGIGSEAKSLQHFWWAAPDLANSRARMDIEEISSCLRASPSVNSITLRNVRLGWSDDVGADVEGLEVNTPPQIKSLSMILVDSALYLSPRSISSLEWLLGRGSLTSLTIDLTSISTSRAYTSFILRILADGAGAHLEQLRLRIGASVGFLEDDADIARFFASCTRLRYLQIWVGSAGGVWSGGNAGTHGEGNFTASAVSHAASLTRTLLSHAMRSCRALETLHLSFFHIAGGLYMSKNSKEQWQLLDHDVTRSLLNPVSTSMRKVMIDTARSPLSNVYEFASVRKVCSVQGYALDVKVDSSLTFT